MHNLTRSKRDSRKSHSVGTRKSIALSVKSVSSSRSTYSPAGSMSSIKSGDTVDNIHKLIMVSRSTSGGAKSKRPSLKYTSKELMDRNEEELEQRQFRRIVLSFLPDNYDVQMPHVTRSYRPTRSSCMQPNCGYCYSLKIFVVITLLLSSLIYLFDPCFRPGANADSLTEKSSILSGNDVTVNDKPEGVKSVTHAVHYCSFKIYFIILLLIGVLVYSMVCMAYSCHLIVYFHNYPWDLTEAVLVFSFSIFLFFSTMLAFVFGGQVVATSFALLDSLLGFVLASVLYRNYHEGVIPAIIAQNDPDGNLITQILSRRLFAGRV